ncbi:MAG: FIST C-terminal domain-containing protein [Natronospirillum sp.]|uniref:FIST N-terminal domain-containing protein n=1 Tax=Natronospirillum sp. TaxID=2812955 RepID=UPI0025EBE51B|nr:FIST N-terminal domain-containing protein [Natronospirillum sp.]MCH8553169.1 FIST C-terminal domain-containing protein [Natronospirillum sp.]
MVQVLTAHTRKQDPAAAVKEVHDQISHQTSSLVLFYCSSEMDLPALAQAFNDQFPGIRIAGCTSAGEMGPLGYIDHSLVVLSFPDELFAFSFSLLQDLSDLSMQEVHDRAQTAKQTLYQHHDASMLQQCFALLLIDGLSLREEPVTRALFNSLQGIPLVGGSAGDNLHFQRSQVFLDGQFHDDSAVLLLAGTPCPIRPFKSQHFEAGNQRMVVTRADEATRRVLEINGLPAAPEYARMTGVDVDNLNPMRFATSPVVVLINGKEYVRSIQKANDDNSLTFYCAIEEGLVFRVAQGVDIYNNLLQTLEDETREVQPQVILAFDCVLRKLEVEQKALRPAFSELLRRFRIVGFNSYGEQYHGIHVNQTFTALLIGEPSAEEGR